MNITKNTSSTSFQTELNSKLFIPSDINAFYTFTPHRLKNNSGGAWMKSFSLSLKTFLTPSKENYYHATYQLQFFKFTEEFPEFPNTSQFLNEKTFDWYAT